MVSSRFESRPRIDGSLFNRLLLSLNLGEKGERLDTVVAILVTLPVLLATLGVVYLRDRLLVSQ